MKSVTFSAAERLPFKYKRKGGKTYLVQEFHRFYLKSLQRKGCQMLKNMVLIVAGMFALGFAGAPAWSMNTGDSEIDDQQNTAAGRIFNIEVESGSRADSLVVARGGGAGGAGGAGGGAGPGAGAGLGRSMGPGSGASMGPGPGASMGPGPAAGIGPGPGDGSGSGVGHGSGHGPGDGTGNDGNGPEDGTGYGAAVEH